MKIKNKIEQLTGAGGIIMGLFLPFALIGIILNVFFLQWFKMNTGIHGIIIGAVFLVLGIPFWLISIVQMLRYVPQNKLITKGPFRIMLHPIYTSIALFVIPGLSLVLDTWVGFGFGVILYIISRIFRIQEEKKLENCFSEEYKAYRSGVLIPWL